jgi:hypothetical protein
MWKRGRDGGVLGCDMRTALHRTWGVLTYDEATAAVRGLRRVAWGVSRSSPLVPIHVSPRPHHEHTRASGFDGMGKV